MLFSRKSVVRLAEGTADAFGHAQLDTLFYEYDVHSRDPGSANANKIKRSMALVGGIEELRPRVVTVTLCATCPLKHAAIPNRHREHLNSLTSTASI